jgi:hypothetical protein
LVEHATENRSVGGSIPPLGTTPFVRIEIAEEFSRLVPLNGHDRKSGTVLIPRCSFLIIKEAGVYGFGKRGEGIERTKGSSNGEDLDRGEVNSYQFGAAKARAKSTCSH